MLFTGLVSVKLKLITPVAGSKPCRVSTPSVSVSPSPASRGIWKVGLSGSIVSSWLSVNSCPAISTVAMSPMPSGSPITMVPWVVANCDRPVSRPTSDTRPEGSWVKGSLRSPSLKLSSLLPGSLSPSLGSAGFSGSTSTVGGPLASSPAARGVKGLNAGSS